MDPRGASPVADPSGALAALCERRGFVLPHISAARCRTTERTSAARSVLAKSPAVGGVATCIFGSWAREELTDESDHDWAVLFDGGFRETSDEVVTEERLARSTLGEDDRRPGGQDIFGLPFSVEDLVDHIGLDRDSNTNLTRRMLLLLESVELHGRVRDEAVDRVLDRYFDQAARPNRVPRFLLNDLVRYWRTICVDFEGKAAEKQGRDMKWATRNAKLRTSRKLLFAGGLVTVMLCARVGDVVEMRGFVRRWFDAVPLDRLAAAFEHAATIDTAMLDVAQRTFGAYDRWLGIVADTDAREALLAATPASRDASAVFNDVRQIGYDFERGLLALLFSPAYEDLTRSHAIF